MISRVPHFAPLSSRGRRRAARRRGGFTLVEVLIVVVILGIIATIVIPQFSGASQQARENTLKEELQYLRTQIAVFKAQHQDVPPGYPNGNPLQAPLASALTAQMTEYSDMYCNISATANTSYPYGPYLTQLPANPVNGMTTFEMVGNNQTFPAPDGTTGWLYQPQTQQLEPNCTGNDNGGVPYASY